MPTPKLNNYLRTYRKVRGFTQREMAFLLGCRNPAKVSRYEQSRRVPSLETIFAYETILGISAQELFAGVQERAQRSAMHRVRLLRRSLDRQTKNPILARKVEFLRSVAEGGANELHYEAVPKT
jgi:transcriptional regulator with XRE-family HTH domain